MQIQYHLQKTAQTDLLMVRTEDCVFQVSKTRKLWTLHLWLKYTKKDIFAKVCKIQEFMQTHKLSARNVTKQDWKRV